MSNEVLMDDSRSVRRLVVYILLFMVVMFWGLTWPIGRIVAAELPALFAAFLRYTIAIPFFFIFAYITKRDELSMSALDHLKIGLLGLLQVSLYNYFYLSGLRFTSSSDATLIIAINPSITAILASKLYPDERLNLKRVAGFLFAIMGVVLIVYNSPNTNVENRILGNFLILVAAGVWATFTAVSRPVLRRVHPTVFSFWGTFYGWLALFFVALIVDTNYFRLEAIYGISSIVMLSLVYLGVIAAFFANSVFNFSVRQIGSSYTAIFVNFVPVFGIIYSIILLDEAFSWVYILSFALIGTGVYIVNKYRN